MLNITTLILPLLLVFGSPKKPVPKKDCEQFKKGRFELLDKNKKSINVIVERKGDVQTEYDENGNVTYSLKIVWTDNCSYYLQFISRSDDETERNANKKLLVEIIKVKGKIYKYKASFEGKGKKKVNYGWIRKLD